MVRNIVMTCSCIVEPLQLSTSYIWHGLLTKKGKNPNKPSYSFQNVIMVEFWVDAVTKAIL